MMDQQESNLKERFILAMNSELMMGTFASGNRNNGTSDEKRITNINPDGLPSYKQHDTGYSSQCLTNFIHLGPVYSA